MGKLPVIPSTDRELPNPPVYPGRDNPKGVILVYVDFWDEAAKPKPKSFYIPFFPL